MTPNNNLSVLPFYTSLAEQNARKWWVNGKVYPLIAPRLNVPPFQIMRSTLKALEYINDAVYYDNIVSGLFIINASGEVVYDDTGSDQTIIRYDLPSDTAKIRLTDTDFTSLNGKAIAFYDTNDECKGTIDASGTQETMDINVPEGTEYIYIVQDISLEETFDVQEGIKCYEYGDDPAPITSIKKYTKDGVLYRDLSSRASLMTVKALTGYDVIVFTAENNLEVITTAKEGQYYLEISDGTNTWYSDIFTCVQDVSCFTRLEWWDVADFVMDAGTIVYTSPAFKNWIYLQTEIAKPDYNFEEESEERDGYTFAMKQISKKVYHFTFLASEYLLDVLRFVRMADYVKIYSEGKEYSADSFLITPEWESEGDIATVTAEFTTDTVAKKIGLAYNQN